MPYALGIDLGSGRTTAAISRNDPGRGRGAQVVPLDGAPSGVPSVLHVTEHGMVEVGEAAIRALPERAAWIARDVPERVGDEIPITLGGEPYPAEVLTAAVIGWIVDQVEATENAPATHLVVTHPANWGTHRRTTLLTALREVSLPELTLLPRPVAAAENHAATDRVEVGEELAVHALGATRFEAAVLRKGSFGFEPLTHTTEESLAGTVLDDLLTDHVLAGLDSAPTGPALASLRAKCTAAKERLSTEGAVTVAGVRVTRGDWEDLIRPTLESTVESLRRTIQSADVHTVVLVGGCAQIPLLRRLVSTTTRARVVPSPDPATAMARGAALAAAKVAKPTVRATAPAVTPEPLTPSAVTHTDLMRLDDLPEADLSDLGPPPPRPPVDIVPLEPPKRRLLRRPTRDEKSPRRNRTPAAPEHDSRPESPRRRPARSLTPDRSDVLPRRKHLADPTPHPDDPVDLTDHAPHPDPEHLADPEAPARSHPSHPDDPVHLTDPEAPARPHPSHPDDPSHHAAPGPPHPSQAGDSPSLPGFEPPRPHHERSTRSHPNHLDQPMHPTGPERSAPSRSHPNHLDDPLHPADLGPPTHPPARVPSHPHPNDPVHPDLERPARTPAHSHPHLQPTDPESSARTRSRPDFQPPPRTRHHANHLDGSVQPNHPETPARSRHREPDPDPNAGSRHREPDAHAGANRHRAPDDEAPAPHSHSAMSPEPRRHRRPDDDPGPSPARSRRHRYRDDGSSAEPRHRTDRDRGRR
ncbi:Hsp70 family protein [Actinophytocola gossypii]|uniref:Hsp70 family protein n=1 Tax=Actinophytocola gossypii TaxID=2812003 RepID=A0ABT2JJV4_9PSEU|nr:Hsp70 family protein [Actinophytocola gossypii]MCT2588046.1 Hsp70 family protein [Actinophytocola gossypii]